MVNVNGQWLPDWDAYTQGFLQGYWIGALVVLIVGLAGFAFNKLFRIFK